MLTKTLTRIQVTHARFKPASSVSKSIMLYVQDGQHRECLLQIVFVKSISTTITECEIIVYLKNYASKELCFKKVGLANFNNTYKILFLTISK